MRNLRLVITFLLLSAAVGVAQRSPDVEALLDAFTAKNLAQVSKHLPPATQKLLSEMPEADRLALEGRLVMSRMMQQEGLKITRHEDGAVLVTVEAPAEKGERIAIVLDKRISDGYESVLRLSVRSPEERPVDDGALMVWMRYMEGDWRVIELQPANQAFLNLEDGSFFNAMGHDNSKANESSAVGALRTYNTAIVTYLTTFEVGLPASLEALGGDEKEASPSHALLVDSVLSTPPFERSGYRFSYRVAGSGEYILTARPLEYGRTGSRNFFTDESGIIRFTDDDREATKDDAPLQ